MIIYNVTVKVDNDIHDGWLEWMQQKHIPDVMKTGCFVQNEIAQVLVDDTDGITYSIQYRCNGMPDLDRYMANFAADLQAEHTARYQDKFVAFRTLLELKK